MAIDSETAKVIEARADRIRARRGEEIRKAKENRRPLDEHVNRRTGYLSPLRRVFRFAEIES